jgi:squalene-hopene/tetraprenyl-beta-curcumene cyclase
VKRGIAYLQSVQQEDGFWWHRSHNAPGFPRIFYLKYHGYTAYFPLWALARYRRLAGAAAARASAARGAAAVAATDTAVA